MRCTGRHFRALEGFVGPVTLIDSALGNPLLQYFFLGGCQRFVRFRRRHHDTVIGRVDPRKQFAGLRITGNNCTHALTIGGGSRRRIQPQVGLPLAGVGAVTGKTVFRKNGPDIPVEVNGFGRWLRCRQRAEAIACRQNNDASDRLNAKPTNVDRQQLFQATYRETCLATHGEPTYLQD